MEYIGKVRRFVKAGAAGKKFFVPLSGNGLLIRIEGEGAFEGENHMKQMDTQEAERLVETYSDLILRLSCTWLRSTHDAEDICQTVLLKLLTGEERFDSPEHEKAWVIRTAINACKDELRAFRRRAAPLEDAPEPAAPEVPRSDVLEAVQALPDKYRQAIFLFYYEGYSVKEIAGLTGRSEAAVSAHLSRGRKKLRTMLGGMGYGQTDGTGV